MKSELKVVLLELCRLMEVAMNDHHKSYRVFNHIADIEDALDELFEDELDEVIYVVIAILEDVGKLAHGESLDGRCFRDTLCQTLRMRMHQQMQ